MAGLLFGTGGIPHSARTRTTIDGIKRIAELGLGCMEIEFVQGVKMGEAGAHLVAETAAETGVELSAHAPYFINFNAREPEKVRASQGRLLQTARIASLCGAKSAVFHTAFYLGDSPEKAYGTIKKHLSEVMEQLKRENMREYVRELREALEMMVHVEEIKREDPEQYQLMQLEGNLRGRIMELEREYDRIEAPTTDELEAARKKVRGEMTAAVGDLFDVKVAMRRREVDRLRKELAKHELAIKKAEARKADLVEKRVRDILGEEEEVFDW